MHAELNEILREEMQKMKCPRCEFIGLEWDWIAKKIVTVTKKRNKKGCLSLVLKFISHTQSSSSAIIREVIEKFCR
jgi:hypothetical protein